MEGAAEAYRSLSLLLYYSDFVAETGVIFFAFSSVPAGRIYQSRPDLYMLRPHKVA